LNDNIALNRALAKLAAVSSERDRYIQAFNQLEVAVTHHRRDAGTIAFSDADERLWKARDKLLVDLTAKQVKLPRAVVAT